MTRSAGDHTQTGEALEIEYDITIVGGKEGGRLAIAQAAALLALLEPPADAMVLDPGTTTERPEGGRGA
jgi:hypothetical protein